jgi:hypothetical protein
MNGIKERHSVEGVRVHSEVDFQCAGPAPRSRRDLARPCESIRRLEGAFGAITFARELGTTYFCKSMAWLWTCRRPTCTSPNLQSPPTFRIAGHPLGMRILGDPTELSERISDYALREAQCEKDIKPSMFGPAALADGRLKNPAARWFAERSTSTARHSHTPASSHGIGPTSSQYVYFYQ